MKLMTFPREGPILLSFEHVPLDPGSYSPDALLVINPVRLARVWHKPPRSECVPKGRFDCQTFIHALHWRNLLACRL
jgi:hypothetical protein